MKIEKWKISEEYQDLFKAYPFNVSRHIFRTESEALHIHTDRLIEAISLLEDKEKEVLRLRFLEKKLLESIAKGYGVTPARITQIQTLAISNLKRMREKYISVPRSELESLMSENRALKEENIQFKLSLEEIQTYDIDMGEIKKLAEYRTLMETPIESLKLKTRPFRALKRNDINTLREVCRLTYSEIRALDEVGDVSAREIVEALNVYGIELRKEEKST